MSIILGMLFGAALLGLVFFLSLKGVALRWYEWLLGALGLILAVWAIHDFFASMVEYNESAGRTLLWIIGIPAVVLLTLRSCVSLGEVIRKLPAKQGRKRQWRIRRTLSGTHGFEYNEFQQTCRQNGLWSAWHR